jgi:hypothetical protein
LEGFHFINKYVERAARKVNKLSVVFINIHRVIVKEVDIKNITMRAKFTLFWALPISKRIINNPV